MTREESWQIESVTLTLLRHVASLGFTVSEFRFPSSLLDTWPACIEMHALDLLPRRSSTSGGSSTARSATWTTGARACLAELVGVDVEDG